MRNIVLAITTVMAVSFATALKANSVNQVKDLRSYGECLALATQRGWVGARARQQCVVATASLKKG
jgi:hypothetical protein